MTLSSCNHLVFYHMIQAVEKSTIIFFFNLKRTLPHVYFLFYLHLIAHFFGSFATTLISASGALGFRLILWPPDKKTHSVQIGREKFICTISLEMQLGCQCRPMSQ